MPLKVITTPRRRLADEVYEQLIAAIMRNEIGREDRLVQEKLAAQLNISRTPVREALMRLEAEGVLELGETGGFRLARLSEDEVHQLYQARAAIEGQAARILAARKDRKTAERLRALIEKEEASTKSDVSDYFAANRNIHRAFVEHTGNRFLVELFDSVWGKGMAFHVFAAIGIENLESSLGEHMSLVDAIDTGDLTIAFQASVDHIQAGFDLQMSAMRAQEDAL